MLEITMQMHLYITNKLNTNTQLHSLQPNFKYEDVHETRKGKI